MAADRLWQSKREILDSVGFDTPQEFPISADGMPQQLLSYLRLSRLQNAAEFAKVNCTTVRLPANVTLDCLYCCAAAVRITSLSAVCVCRSASRRTSSSALQMSMRCCSYCWRSAATGFPLMGVSALSFAIFYKQIPDLAAGMLRACTVCAKRMRPTSPFQCVVQ